MNKSIWDIFKKANATPDLKSNLQDMTDSKRGLENRLATMRDLNEEILSTSGPEGHAEHLRAMREIEDKIVTFDTAIGILNKRIEEASVREDKEWLENCGREAVVDSNTQFELASKFLKLMIEAYAVRQHYFQVKGKVDVFRQLASKAGRLDLKPPADPLFLAFVDKTKNPFHHPIEYPQLFHGLEAVHQFDLLLNKLEIEA